jgi:uncharacterized protein
MTGATGFVGRALSLRLLGLGHQLIAWVRDEARARDLLGPDVELASANSQIGRQVARADAVINLAGEPIFDGRWTNSRKRAIRDSRLKLTREIANAIAQSTGDPKVLISASAVGYYGDRGDENVNDDTPAGTGFLATLCRDWESAALEAETSGTRVFIPRIGIVLGAGGGALLKMVLPFRFGAGGPIGTGRQYIPWIHIDDLVGIIVAALTDERLHGPLLATAPNPVTSREFATAIGATLRRPSLLPVPGFALRIVLGEAASALQTGQRVFPQRLEQVGFEWRYRHIEAALADILNDNDPEITAFDETASKPPPGCGSKYLASGKPTSVLSQRTLVYAPIEKVFQFFFKPQNLGVMMPSSMQFRILSEVPDEMREGLQIEYAIKLGPLRLRWRTRIKEWQPPGLFAYSQESGPYRCWWHQHRFQPDGDRTLMEDRVYYAPPLGLAGTLINSVFVAPALRRIFSYRKQAMRLRFHNAGS